MMRLPDFIVAGVRKCGTTWLHTCLSEHPQIFVPPQTKEIFFFDRHWDRGLAWYARHFAAAPPGRICGEATPGYFAVPGMPERIKGAVPDAKIVFVFRDPIRRAVSLYQHMLSIGYTRLSFADALEEMPEIIDEGHYDSYFESYERCFGRAALFPLILEQAKAEGDAGLAALFAFLGVDPAFRPPSLLRTAYEQRTARNHVFGWLTGRLTMVFRDRGLHWVVNGLKRAGFRRLLYKDRADTV
ncbi:MAG TPA: sulfotransferase, partial [Rhizomicrobium sp.]|nr:sulfotransferase [Rhizomicrobium sp.]